MINSTGLTGAAPIWSQFMQAAEMLVSNNSPTPFSRPAGVVDETICSVSGTKPSEFCPSEKQEIFAFDQPPLDASQDLWKRVRVDTWTGLISSAACGDFVKDIDTVNVKDESARKVDPRLSGWAKLGGKNGIRRPDRFHSLPGMPGGRSARGDRLRQSHRWAGVSQQARWISPRSSKPPKTSRSGASIMAWETAPKNGFPW